MHKKYLSDSQRMDVDTTSVKRVKFLVDSVDGVISLSGEEVEELIEQLGIWADANFSYKMYTDG